MESQVARCQITRSAVLLCRLSQGSHRVFYSNAGGGERTATTPSSSPSLPGKSTADDVSTMRGGRRHSNSFRRRMIALRTQRIEIAETGGPTGCVTFIAPT